MCAVCCQWFRDVFDSQISRIPEAPLTLRLSESGRSSHIKDIKQKASTETDPSTVQVLMQRGAMTDGVRSTGHRTALRFYRQTDNIKEKGKHTHEDYYKRIPGVLAGRVGT